MNNNQYIDYKDKYLYHKEIQIIIKTILLYI